MNTKPWDARVANFLVRPLRNTGVTPNHITTLRLLTGLAAAGAFAVGHKSWVNWGALLFVVSNVIDHADGELARLTGKTSKWGHYYDLYSDALVQILLFVGMGYGLRDSGLGTWGLPMGIVAGLSIAVIFFLRMIIEDRKGKSAIEQPYFAGFEMEDVLYLLVPVTWFGWLPHFLMAAAVGSPIFALWTLWDFRKTSFSSVTDDGLSGR